MPETEIVKMSSKGQLVVPEDIRDQEDFKPGDYFVPFPVKEGVLFKRISIPEVRADFKALAKDIESHFKKQKVSPKTVDEAVRWARRA